MLGLGLYIEDQTENWFWGLAYSQWTLGIKTSVRFLIMWATRSPFKPSWTKSSSKPNMLQTTVRQKQIGMYDTSPSLAEKSTSSLSYPLIPQSRGGATYTRTLGR